MIKRLWDAVSQPLTLRAVKWIAAAVVILMVIAVVVHYLQGGV